MKYSNDLICPYCKKVQLTIKFSNLSFKENKTNLMLFKCLYCKEEFTVRAKIKIKYNTLGKEQKADTPQRCQDEE